MSEFINPETARRFEVAAEFNWNRNVHIPAVYGGPISEIPPQVAELMIKQGRKDLWEIKPEAEIKSEEAS